MATTAVATIDWDAKNEVACEAGSDFAKALSLVVNNDQQKADALCRMFTTVARTTPKLMQCEPLTVMGFLMQCGELGLEPATGLGHIYPVPFRNRKRQGSPLECTAIIGYQGMMHLAYRANKIEFFDAHTVYTDDEFAFRHGTDQYLHYVPALEQDPDRKVRAYFVSVTYKTGMTHFRVMSPAEADKLAGRYGNVWNEHKEAMALKTIMRQMFKWLDISTEMREAISLDDLAYNQVSQRDRLAGKVPHGLLVKQAGGSALDAMAAEAAAAPPEEPVKEEPESGEPTVESVKAQITALMEEDGGAQVPAVLFDKLCQKHKVDWVKALPEGDLGPWTNLLIALRRGAAAEKEQDSTLVDVDEGDHNQGELL